MVERIEQIIEYLKISVRSFEQQIGASNGLIRKAISNKSDIQSKWISRIVENYPQFNIEWLITGNGDMLKNESQARKIYTITPQESITQESVQSYISDKIISIPIVDVSAAAGHGFFNSDHPEALGELKFPVSMLKNHSGNYYCGRVNGESMAPTLLNQDFIIFRLLTFDEWEYLKDDNVYFIVDRAGTSYVKRIKNRFHEDGTILCMSDNVDKANFRDFPVYGEDIANIYHVGWRFSKDMANINESFFSRMAEIEDRVNMIERKLLGDPNNNKNDFLRM